MTFSILLLKILIVFLNSLYVYISVQEYVQVNVSSHVGKKQVLGPLELDVWDVVNNLIWVKGAELWSYERIVSLHHPAVSPVQGLKWKKKEINADFCIPYFSFNLIFLVTAVTKL